jgi:hypothetical protein
VQPAGGFLPQPDALVPGTPGQAALVYYAPGADFSSYRRVILNPVVVISAPDSPLAQTSQEQRTALANTFTSDLKAALGNVCTLTRRPGPGTLSFTFALVDANPSNATEKTAATYVPYVSAAYSVGSLAFNDGVGYFAGTATAEGYATDSRTGAVVWQAVDKRGGTTALVQNTFNNWLDVDHAFKAWAERIAAGLQNLGVCRK